MTSEDFIKLYTKDSVDELITPINDAVGFTLVRNYDPNSEYFKDNKKMFIKIYFFNDKNIKGGIEIVDSSNDGKGSYRIVSGDKYKKRITGFSLSKEDGFIFNEENKKIYKPIKKKNFSIDKFIEILVDNHLSDLLFWKRKKNHVVNNLLKFLFWLSDKHYEKTKVMLNIYSFEKENKPDETEEKKIEPFFKYFSITKNILFIFLFFACFLSIFLSFSSKIKNFSLSDPSVILFFFLVLFIGEKFSIYLSNKIKLFYKKDNNFIYKLHNYLFDTSFRLKI